MTRANHSQTNSLGQHSAASVNVQEWRPSSVGYGRTGEGPSLSTDYQLKSRLCHSGPFLCLKIPTPGKAGRLIRMSCVVSDFVPRGQICCIMVNNYTKKLIDAIASEAKVPAQIISPSLELTVL